MARVEVLSSAMLIMAVATLPASPQESDRLGSGSECLYRPFELTFFEALSEDQYQKWEKRIVKKMEKMRKK